MNPHTYGHIIFDKGAKTIQWKKTAFSANSAGLTVDQHIDPFLSPCTMLNSKLIKDLFIKPDTLKWIEEKVSGWENVLSRIPVVYALRSTIDKWDLRHLS